MSAHKRWSAAKCQRIQDKLAETVSGASDDAEHLLDVLIAAWDEMHREARQLRGAVEALDELLDLIEEQDWAKDRRGTLMDPREQRARSIRAALGGQ